MVPLFKTWRSLPAQFSALKSAIEDQFLTLKHGPDIGVVTPSVYNAMNSPSLLLAKMALLNLYAVLTVQRIRSAARSGSILFSRFFASIESASVAKVSAELFESIDHILNNLSRFAELGFFPGEVSLHLDNIPKEFQVTAPMISARSVDTSRAIFNSQWRKLEIKMVTVSYLTVIWTSTVT